MQRTLIPAAFLLLTLTISSVSASSEVSFFSGKPKVAWLVQLEGQQLDPSNPAVRRIHQRLRAARVPLQPASEQSDRDTTVVLYVDSMQIPNSPGRAATIAVEAYRWITLPSIPNSEPFFSRVWAGSDTATYNPRVPGDPDIVDRIVDRIVEIFIDLYRAHNKS